MQTVPMDTQIVQKQVARRQKDKITELSRCVTNKEDSALRLLHEHANKQMLKPEANVLLFP